MSSVLDSNLKIGNINYSLLHVNSEYTKLKKSNSDY